MKGFKWCIGSAVFILISTLVYSFYVSDDHGNPSTSLMQVGATISLLIVTMAYAISAQGSLTELKEARFDSLRPTLSLRYVKQDDGQIHTYVYNVGTGVATDIVLWTNEGIESVHLGSSIQEAYKRKLSRYAGNDAKFGMPLGVHNGDRTTQVDFLSSNLTPILIKHLEYVLEYKDVFGRCYITHLVSTKQTVHGPFSQQEKEKYIEDKSREKLTEEEYKRHKAAKENPKIQVAFENTDPDK